MEATEKAAGRRAGLATLLRIAVSMALVAWILRKTPVPQVLAAFRSADLRFVLLALALSPIGYWASVSRWRLLLRSQGGDASFGFLLRSFLVGVFFNNLLPSTIGGDAVRAVATSRAGVGRAAAVTVIFVDRFLGLLALMLFAVGGVLVSGRLTERVPALYTWVLAGALGLGLAAVFLKRIGRAFRGRGSVLARAFGLSLILQVAVVLHYYFLAKALHVPIPLPDFFLIVPLSLFVMMVPVSINAIGVRENVLAFFFAAFGVASVQAVAVAWLDYGLVLLQALVGGAVYAWGRRPAHDVLPAEEAAR
ncbi:MAG TPA: lysylphosphatidylglycerol synthase transmembrane domain-containing protein [Thermoanaerobaculia bacterium]